MRFKSAGGQSDGDYPPCLVFLYHSHIYLHSGFPQLLQHLLIAVAVGDNVLSGSVVGKVGNSAAAEVTENSHLHFEVSVNEESVNPHDYLAVPQTDSPDVQE